jgi:hypothetical protein
MTDRRDFLSVLAGASWAAAACGEDEAPPGDELERALEDLTRAAGLAIADDDFEAARGYAAGAYREAARSLRSIPLDSSLDLPIAFAAKRGDR